MDQPLELPDKSAELRRGRKMQSRKTDRFHFGDHGLGTLLSAEPDRPAEWSRPFGRTIDPTSLATEDHERSLGMENWGGPTRISKLRTVPVDAAILEHYRRRKTSLEEVLLEIYNAGLSVRQAENVTKTLWGKRVGLAKVSELNREITERIEVWLKRPITGAYPYVFIDGTPLRRAWGNEEKCVSILVAIGVNASGRREVLGIAEGTKEDAASAETFCTYLRDRGLSGVKLYISGPYPALTTALARVFPNAAFQCCITQFCDHALSLTPVVSLARVTELLGSIGTSEDLESARMRAAQVISELRVMRLEGVAEHVEEGIEPALSFYALPKPHWHSLRANDALRKILREIRERARVVGAFSDGKSGVHLAAARLRQIERNTWSNGYRLKGMAAADVGDVAVYPNPSETPV